MEQGQCSGVKHGTARVEVLAANDGECMVIGEASGDADEQVVEV